MALNAQILVSILAHETSNDGLGQTVRATPASYSRSLTDGTGESQAQVVWSAARTLAGSSETLDSAALPDNRAGVPATVTMTAVKLAYARNSGTVALSFAGAPFPATGITVAPGGCVSQIDSSAAGMNASGITVTGSAGATYDILLIGEGTVT